VTNDYLVSGALSMLKIIQYHELNNSHRSMKPQLCQIFLKENTHKHSQNSKPYQ